MVVGAVAPSCAIWWGARAAGVVAELIAAAILVGPAPQVLGVVALVLDAGSAVAAGWIFAACGRGIDADVVHAALALTALVALVAP